MNLEDELNNIGRLLFGCVYLPKRQPLTIDMATDSAGQFSCHAMNQSKFEPKLIKIGDDKAMDAIGFKIFGSEYPAILNRKEPAWTDAEWWKIKRFDAASAPLAAGHGA